MVLLDLLGRRWTLRIVWELREEPRRFRELQDLIGASPTIVNTRLAELREAKLVGSTRRPAIASRRWARSCCGCSCRCTSGRRSGRRLSEDGLSSPRPARRGGNCSAR